MTKRLKEQASSLSMQSLNLGPLPSFLRTQLSFKINNTKLTKNTLLSPRNYADLLEKGRY
jgi:hypothetical protein